LLFAEAGVDRALIEVGLGGRLDSTNVVDPAVTCITSIELEHTDKLGDTEAAIAAEKAGILKPGRPVILGSLRPDASRVIRARAQAVGARVVAGGEHFTVLPQPDRSDRHAFVFQETGTGTDSFEIRASLRAPGAAAIGNAGLAIACVRALGVHAEASMKEAIRTGLAECTLPARIEVLANDAAVIVDAAHTTESARALADSLAILAPGGFELILSVSSDKNLDAMLDALLPGASRVWVTRADRSRSMSVDVLAKNVLERAPNVAIEIVDDPEEAARRARASLPPDARLCAAGSIYLAGIVRGVLGVRSE
jgi:dihydrofolate synthase/folylpolyglutamate synthase